MASSMAAREEIEALLRRQQQLVTQLRALVLPSLLRDNVGGESAELAVQLFDDVIGCNTSAVSSLLRAGGSLFGAEPAVDDKSLVRKKMLNRAISPGEIRMKEEEQTRPVRSVATKRRRKDGKRSRSLVTNVPHYDGHQWRKYGQKNINGMQHSRSYYRCTYKERNCSATKTVQEQDHNRSSFSYGDETVKYTVVYYGHHTCNGENISNGNVDLPQLVSMDLDQTVEEMARMTTYQAQEFDEGDLDVPALLEVLDNPLLNWDMW